MIVVRMIACDAIPLTFGILQNCFLLFIYLFIFYVDYLRFEVLNDTMHDCLMQVERTKSRPVASGLLTPFQGLCFLGFQLLLGLGILLQLNNYRLVLILNSQIYVLDLYVGALDT